MLKYRVVPLIAVLAAVPLAAFCEDRFEEPPINYSGSQADNPVSRLQQGIANGAVHLQSDEQFGYLKSLLDYLKVPLESQVLVFSKTSLQQQYISPTNPRVLYFNDDVYVGTVPGADVIEISTADPSLGAVFYTMPKSDRDPLAITRQKDNCLQCHGSTLTDNVPGHVIRSVFTDARGHPILKAGSRVTTQDSPFEERWGGWYVTGTHGSARHMGNGIATESEHGAELDTAAGANVTALPERVIATNYLTPHSDIVALLVLEHQTRMHNLLTQANYETRMALKDQAIMDELLQRPAGTLSESTLHRIANTGAKLVDYMLFAHEARLSDRIAGTSGFAEMFSRQGPRDHLGRSLRDFDLQGRVFKYPLSYLLYSPQFDGLPREMKDYVYRRLWDILTGAIPQEKGFPLTQEQRQALREIVAETKPGLPAYWTAR